jgi:epoxyqueuosine reductase
MAAVPKEMMHDRDAQALHLEILGALHESGETLLLLGPREPGFWPAFTASPEFGDGAPDPLDRYSKRLIGGLAVAWGGEAVFPSDGPPYPPFIAWALATGHVWQSPVGLMVHDRQGLWLSFRGAVRLPGLVPLVQQGKPPCSTCEGQPCRDACPVGALHEQRYDVAGCKAFLARPDGTDCMESGCAVRRTCPVSRAYGRLPQQSAFHMRSFFPG